jgi:CDP-glycerol glycerophosphotransferase (TagB/SpsB family)
VELEQIGASGFFDRDYYLANNPDVARKGVDPLEHFCLHGWRELRNPSKDFDVWWYWFNYLNPAQETVNPLVHYAQRRDKSGVVCHPRLAASRPGGSPPAFLDRTPKRICLFAGYDPHAKIDPYVVHYVAELSKFADVYFLTDTDTPKNELVKLGKHCAGAWAERHRLYDFGSYSLLANKYVGWDRISQYDELLLVNDSAYLVSELGPVFDTMNRRACDYWGLQATKGIYRTRNRRSNAFSNAIPMAAVKKRFLPHYESDYDYDFLLGSYFLAFRRRAMASDVLRRLLQCVSYQKTKYLIIKKYEISLNRFLLAGGYEMDSFLPHLYPLHPVYSNRAFTLIGQGFPLLKRFLLSSNHYRVPGLYKWKAKLKRRAPLANIHAISAHFTRTVPLWKRLRNLYRLPGNSLLPADAIHRGKISTLSFWIKDRLTRKDPRAWAFPVCGYDQTFTGNERAIFEEVKDDPGIRKIILTRGLPISLEGTNIEVAPLQSLRGQQLLLESGCAFIKHTPRRNLVYPVEHRRRALINVWHGIPLKRIGLASLDATGDMRRFLLRQHKMCRAVISSSSVDRMAMASAFYPLTYEDVWLTGLPRNDFILRSSDLLPGDMGNELQRLKEELGGRRMVLFVPTFRNNQQQGYYSFTIEERNRLAGVLRAHNAVLAIREHAADKSLFYSSQFAGLPTLDASRHAFPNIEMLYRLADGLITDYSSCFIDFMLTGKPMLSFAYDLECYANRERGFFYPMDQVFPGPICRTASELVDGLDALLANGASPTAFDYLQKTRLFFEYIDSNSAKRVVERAKSSLGIVSGTA